MAETNFVAELHIIIDVKAASREDAIRIAEEKFHSIVMSGGYDLTVMPALFLREHGKVWRMPERD